MMERSQGDRVELAHQFRLRAGAVLEVDDQPVEAGPARSSAWIAEPPLTNEPKSVSPARILARSEPAGGGWSGTGHLCGVLGSERHHDGRERVTGRIERSGTSAHL